MHEDLAQLGISKLQSLLQLLLPNLNIFSVAGDIRRENMLKAPSPLPNIKPCLSPFSKQAYGWRIIDFEDAEKCNYSVAGCRMYHFPACAHAFDHIEEGFANVYPEDEEYLGSEDSDA